VPRQGPTNVTISLIAAGSIDAFDPFTYETNLRSQLRCSQPTCTVSLSLGAASVHVLAEVSDLQPTSPVAAIAATMRTVSLSELSNLLGIQVEGGLAVSNDTSTIFYGDVEMPSPVRCPKPQGCLEGGSCAQGHFGPLCGLCIKGYTQGRSHCYPCPDLQGSGKAAAGTMMTLGVVAMASLVLAVLYLRRSPSGPRHTTMSKMVRNSKLARLRALIGPSTLNTAATLLKIAIGHAQCMTSFGRFERVSWPPMFRKFLELFDNFTLEVFEFLPVDCALDEPLTFHHKLIVTLFVPLITAVLVTGLASVAVPSAPASDMRRSTVVGKVLWQGVAASPQFWTLLIWLLLLEYPLLCRAPLATFDCISVNSESLLRSDVRVSCDTASWRGWAGLSGVAILVYCLGLPAVFLIAAYRCHMSEDVCAQQKIALLVASYRDGVWFWEGLELVRKFVLTSVILQVFPGSKLQIWFGAAVCMMSLVHHVALQPYAKRTSQRTQSAALTQLALTYLAALLFFEWTPEEDVSASEQLLDGGLIAGNLICFLLILVAASAGVFGMAVKSQELVATLSDGRPIILQPPSANGGYHIFLSHCWTHGQDAMSTVKSMLRLLLPGIECFLDVDNLKSIAELEEYVNQTDLVRSCSIIAAHSTLLTHSTVCLCRSLSSSTKDTSAAAIAAGSWSLPWMPTSHSYCCARPT